MYHGVAHALCICIWSCDKHDYFLLLQKVALVYCLLEMFSCQKNEYSSKSSQDFSPDRA